MDHKIKVRKLEDKIKSLSEAYYNREPIIPDEEFDKLVNELRDIDPDNILLKKTGWGIEVSPNNPRAFKHICEVGGLDKVQYAELKSVTEFDIHSDGWVSIKLDGISAVAYYSNGKLVKVLTRGDGEYGIDITEVGKAAGVPEEVDRSINNLRCEIVVPLSVNPVDHGYPNHLSMVVGLSNTHELNEKHSLLDAVVYDVNIDESKSTHQLINLINHLPKSTDIVLGQYGIIQDGLDWVNSVIYLGTETAPYPIDGAVVRTDNGIWAVKYPTKRWHAKVVKVHVQLSDLGRLIPVIEYEPIHMYGVTATACAGFNFETICNKGVGPGAVIEVTRANQVIPHWTGEVIESVLPYMPVEWNGQKTFWDGVHLAIKPNTLMNSIHAFIGSKAPLGIGPSRIEKLIEVFDIETHEDLSNLSSQHEELDLDEFGAYSDHIRQLLKRISEEGFTLEQMISMSFSKNVGDVASEKIANYFDNDPNKMLVWITECKSNSNIVENTIGIAEHSWLGFISNFETILDILNAGYRVVQPVIEEIVDNTGKILVQLSGRFSVTKSKLMEELGDRVVEVDSGFEYLVLADKDSTSSKAQYARNNGIKIINEQELRDMVK